MKKTTVSIILGIALLATSGVAVAGQQKSTETGWGLRPERTASPSPLDLARWLARRFVQSVVLPIPAPVTIEPQSAPTVAPVTTPAPNDGDVVCDPQRQHCPIG